MTPESLPLVSIVTPVFNGEKYLADCIDSVRAQTYQHWEYIVVNNASTDATLAIAEAYARRDPRLRIHSNVQTVGSIENHNIALRLISPESRYTKIVHADDLLFPECLERMVDVAGSAPAVGLVGAYTLKGGRVVSSGLPYPQTVFSGSEICRQTLRRELYLFPAPSALLIRSDLVRATPAFYNEAHIYADLEACFEVLRHSDFGFVHQVLTFVRVHEESVTAKVVLDRDRHTLAWLDLVQRYGPVLLEEPEYRQVVATRWREYHRFILKAIIGGSAWQRSFWRYHFQALAQLGHSFPVAGLVRTIGEEAARPLIDPIRRLRRLRV